MRTGRGSSPVTIRAAGTVHDTRQGGDVSEDRHLANIVLFYFSSS